jgi:ATP-dependent DNA helicase RecQ
MLRRVLAAHRDESVIVYASTIKMVEEVAAELAREGVLAVAYHGKMDTKARRRNQELWMSDQVRVLVGTLAFGMGINKAAVRAVVHLSLPKSIEQYYQESGRAGRDGEPADCVLLWRKRDAGIIAHFIEEMQDDNERRGAWDRYHAIRNLAESDVCRPLQICRYFGETPKWSGCGHCDVCSGVPDWLSHAAKPVAVKRVEPVVVAEAHPELIEHLRLWRRQQAAKLGVPAYVVLHDTSLVELARRRPSNFEELRAVPGFGQKRVERYGDSILRALAHFGRK